MLVKTKHKGTDELMEIEDLRSELSSLRSQYAVGSLAQLIETLTDAMESLKETESKWKGQNYAGKYDYDQYLAIINGLRYAVAVEIVRLEEQFKKVMEAGESFDEYLDRLNDHD